MSRRADSRATTLEQLFAAKEIVVFCGSGGVGKTSAAAAAALGASVRLGGKTLVLTIDPARRLATALGLDGIGNEAHRVPPDVLKAAGIEPRGELWAAMLDTKQSWDELVMRYAKDEATARRILENHALPQPHRALRAEPRLHRDGAAVRDPRVGRVRPDRDRHATHPQRRRLPRRARSHGRLLRRPAAALAHVAVPGRRSAEPHFINFASRPFYQLADRVLGSKFLEDIAEFFLNFQSMYDGFVERAQSVERLLHDRRTTFVVVTTLEAAPLHEAEHFCAELRDRHFHLGALVLNKTLPDSLLDPAGTAAAARFVDQAGPLAEAMTAVSSPALADPARTARVLTTVGESFANFSVVAIREAELRAELARVPDVVVRVPTFEQDINDVDALLAICGALFDDS